MNEWKLGDFLQIEWNDCPGVLDVLQITREEAETSYNSTQVWCRFLNKSSARAKDKNDEVWISPSEIKNWPMGTLKIISDEKEKLQIILRIK